MANTGIFIVQPLIRPARQPKHFRERESPLDSFTDEELRARFRFGRASLEYIVDLISDDLARTTKRNHAMAAVTQVLIFLRFVASGSFFQVVGDTFGVDKSTVSRTVHRVSSALVRKRDDFIKWPQTDAERMNIRGKFYDLGGFPQVIGCIDGTHVRILAPSVDEDAYVNRKNYHSINVQGICDDTGKFTNIVARWPGCTHDSHIFTSSLLHDYLEENHKGLGSGLLLGDSAYPCKPYLMTPYLAPVLPSEKRFNKAHKTTRCTIERCFGQWKRRFHVLHSEVRLAPAKVCKLIVACAILHNIAKDRGEPMEDGQDDGIDRQIPTYEGVQNGNGVRRHITHTFFN